MAIHAAYANHPKGSGKKDAMWFMQPSNWGGCCAALNERYAFTQVYRESTEAFPESIDYHVYHSAPHLTNNPRCNQALRDFYASDFVQNLAPGIRSLPTLKSIRGKDHVKEQSYVFHVNFDGIKTPVCGLITVLRMANYLANYGDRNLEGIADEDLKYVPYVMSLRYGNRHYSDGSISFVSTPASAFVDYCEDQGEDWDEVYYEVFAQTLGDYGEGNLSYDMGARAYIRSAEEFLERSNQTTGILIDGYVKDESIGSRMGRKLQGVPQKDFEMSISGPVIDVFQEGDTPVIRDRDLSLAQHIELFKEALAKLNK